MFILRSFAEECHHRRLSKFERVTLSSRRNCDCQSCVSFATALSGPESRHRFRHFNPSRVLKLRCQPEVSRWDPGPSLPASSLCCRRRPSSCRSSAPTCVTRSRFQGINIGTNVFDKIKSLITPTKITIYDFQAF
jgi:hypothetical protein